MIYHPIFKLKNAGIKEILIVTGKEHMGDVVNLLGGGKEFDLELTYRVQEEAGGIAHALALAESFVGKQKSVVLLGDNIFADELGEFIEKFKKQQEGAKILIKEVSDPQRYGVAELNGNKVISIEEKPELPKSNYCVTGIYMYDYYVFDVIKNLQPSGRGELEITDVNNAYIKSNNLTFDILKGWWTDAGTFSSLAKATELVNCL
jgi:glucose-1-phosphate thymidylyltransferase